MIQNKNNLLILFITACILVCLSAYKIDIMDIDAAQYANISREMSLSGNYLHVYEQGKDYLDKPPLLFWISALSIHFLGATNFAYKFPSILVFIFSLLSLYFFVKKLYNNDIALLSVLILSSSQAIFLMTNDVRTDLLLMSTSIIAISHIYLYSQTNKIQHFIIGFTAIALGLMTKGPISLYMLIVSLVPHFIIKKDWKNLFNYKYVFGLLWVLLLLAPMCYGLYTQFDLHPEKTVYGIKSPSGIKFFFWTQSFGRITGESSWANNMGFEYLFTNILWSFFPWSILFIFALLFTSYQLLKKQNIPEFISFIGFILTYAALAVSKYQLPHYIFITFPLIAIITANFIYHYQNKLTTIFLIISILCCMLVQYIIVNVFFTDLNTYWNIYLAVEIGIGIILFYYLNKQIHYKKYSWIIIVVFFTIGTNILMTNQFYAHLLNYQASSNIGKYIHFHKIDAKKIDSYNISDGLNSIHFYAQQTVVTNSYSLPNKEYVITSQNGLNDLMSKVKNYEIIQTFPQYNITKLSWSFLNEKTREKQLSYIYLLKKK